VDSSMSSDDLEQAWVAVNNISTVGGVQVGMFYVGFNAPLHASAFSQERNITTAAFSSMDSMFANNSVALVPLCPRAESPELVKYVDRVVQNYTTIITDHIITIVNQTTVIKVNHRFSASAAS
jgi:hypothetical protein